MDASSDSPAPTGPPVLLQRAGLAVVLEGVALALLGAGYALSGVLGEPEDRTATLLEGAFGLLVGLALLPVGRGLGRGRGFALSPTVVVQLFVLIVASGLLQGGVLLVAVPMVLVAGFVLYAVASPASREVFRGAS